MRKSNKQSETLFELATQDELSFPIYLKGKDGLWYEHIKEDGAYVRVVIEECLFGIFFGDIPEKKQTTVESYHHFLKMKIRTHIQIEYQEYHEAMCKWESKFNDFQLGKQVTPVQLNKKTKEEMVNELKKFNYGDKGQMRPKVDSFFEQGNDAPWDEDTPPVDIEKDIPSDNEAAPF